MIKCIIFDLSEVFIDGLYGTKNSIYEKYKLDMDLIENALGKDIFNEIMMEKLQKMNI